MIFPPLESPLASISPVVISPCAVILISPPLLSTVVFELVVDKLLVITKPWLLVRLSSPPSVLIFPVLIVVPEILTAAPWVLIVFCESIVKDPKPFWSLSATNEISPLVLAKFNWVSDKLLIVILSNAWKVIFVLSDMLSIDDFDIWDSVAVSPLKGLSATSIFVSTILIFSALNDKRLNKSGEPKLIVPSKIKFPWLETSTKFLLEFCSADVACSSLRPRASIFPKKLVSSSLQITTLPPSPLKEVAYISVLSST